MAKIKSSTRVTENRCVTLPKTQLEIMKKVLTVPGMAGAMRGGLSTVITIMLDEYLKGIYKVPDLYIVTELMEQNPDISHEDLIKKCAEAVEALDCEGAEYGI